MIDAFLDKHTAPQAPQEAAPAPVAPVREAPATAPQPQESTLSASLARIFISRGSYERALEVLTAMASNADSNPFIDDQIRYLRRLVALKAK